MITRNFGTPNPLVNKRYRRIRALRKKLADKAPILTRKAIAEIEADIERQFKLLPKLIYELSEPAVKIKEEEDGNTSYITRSEFMELLRKGKVSYQ